MKTRIDRIARIWYHLPRLIVRNPRFRIVFHHLPKCGGTSVDEAMRRCFPLDPRIAVRISADASARAATLTRRPLFSVREELLLYHMAISRILYISGHIPFSDRAFQQYGDRWSFVAIIRDPVARWFSAYFYSKELSSSTHGSIDVSLEDYVQSEAGIAAGSAYLSFFAGSMDTKPSLERALETTERFDVVGVLEDLDTFTDAFQARFGKRLDVRHFNRNPVPDAVQRQRVTPALRRRVEQLCEPDLEFYETIRRRTRQHAQGEPASQR